MAIFETNVYTVYPDEKFMMHKFASKVMRIKVTFMHAFLLWTYASTSTAFVVDGLAPFINLQIFLFIPKHAIY